MCYKCFTVLIVKASIIYYTLTTHTPMENVWVNVRFRKAETDKMDQMVDAGRAMSRSDLVRYAVRRYFIDGEARTT